MAWEPEEITVTPEHIMDGITNVLEQDGRVLGLYVLQLPFSPMNGGERGDRSELRTQDPGSTAIPHPKPVPTHKPSWKGASTVELSRMMIEPSAIGTGCGRLLWDHAVSTAQALGISVITLDADPNAEPFYRRMGAETVGEHDWEPPMMPGWRVKKMRYAIPS
ncbi:MAG: GNAT family N-acetyltransferase [Fimbriimonadaceae bacterium]